MNHLSRPILFSPALISCALAGLILVMPAHGATLSATGVYSLDGLPSVNVPPAIATPTNVDVINFPTTSTSSAVLHSYGSASGNFGSRSSAPACTMSPASSRSSRR